MPEIYIVSNVKVNGEAIGSLGDGEAVWHTDMSCLDVPPKASMLYSVEVPLQGGNTSFCSMYAIYDALPGKLKDRISGLAMPVIGFINTGSPDTFAPFVAGFHQGLKESGFIESQKTPGAQNERPRLS